jgi:hypothetical protein
LTQTITTAADLLATGDATFLSLLKVWEDHKQAPLVLVDYLLEWGLPTQAECVRWCATEPKRPQIWGTSTSVELHPYPYYRNIYKWQWCVIGLDELLIYYCDEVPDQLVIDGKLWKAISGDTFAECVCNLMDLWRDR